MPGSVVGGTDPFKVKLALQEKRARAIEGMSFSEAKAALARIGQSIPVGTNTSGARNLVRKHVVALERAGAF